jgi:hypothetical protein
MKTTTSFTYPAFALFVLACFALSPQAFAVAPPTLSPPSYSGCTTWTSVRICCPPNTKIHVWGTGMIEGDLPGTCGTQCCGTINVYHPGSTTLNAYCYVGATHSATVTGTYAKVCTKLILVIGGILLAAVLIWLFVKRSSANR